jgi:hypothetical protein
MELKQLISQLLESKIIENQELGVSLLMSDDVNIQDKKEFLDKFVDDYTRGKIDFFSEDHHNIFKAWVELYMSIKEKGNE